MTKIIKTHSKQLLKNLNYTRPLQSPKSKIRQNKHTTLVKLNKSDVKKRSVLKFRTKNFIRNVIYKRQIRNDEKDMKHGFNLAKMQHSWKERRKYTSRNKWRFWAYSSKELLKQKTPIYWNKKKYHKKGQHKSKFSTQLPLARKFTQVISNFNKSKSFSRKLRILTKKIYYCLLNKTNFKMLALEKGIKKKRFFAHFLPYKWQIIKWKLKQPTTIKKNFVGHIFYYRTKLKRKYQQQKVTFKVYKNFRYSINKYLVCRKQIINHKKGRFYNIIRTRSISNYVSFIEKYFIHFLNAFRSRSKNTAKHLSGIHTIISIKKIGNNNINMKVINWLKYPKRNYLCLPKLKKRKIVQSKQKLKKSAKNKKHYKNKKWHQKRYIKNKRRYFAKKKFWKIKKYKHRRKYKYIWYNNLIDSQETVINVNKKNLIRLESPFFKKTKNYIKIKYLLTPKKYKNIFKNFYFKNGYWRKSFLLNKKFKKYQRIGKRKIINEYNWKITREEPWHTKRAKWLSWNLHAKNKASPFFIGTLFWSNRWQCYYEKYILNKLNKNKLLPVKSDTTQELRPFIRNLILRQKHLPINFVTNNYLQVLFLQYGVKVHWTDFMLISEDTLETDWGVTKLTEKTINARSASPSKEEELIPFFDEDQTFLNQIFHNVKKSSFISYKNWPRQILHHTILLKNIHKRTKLIYSTARKERFSHNNPQPRFNNFHRLFSIDWRINKAAPWFEPLFFPRIVHPIQYFNFWYSKKSIYARKRSKVYRKFSKEAFNLYEPLKYRSSRRGGHRNFNWNRILSKVLLPFFGKTFSQFRSSFDEVRVKKSKQLSRINTFTKNLNSQLYRLIYNFNITPSIFWARKILELGWVYLYPSNVNNNTKIFFNSLSIDKLFPLIRLNKHYSYISNKSAKFTQFPIRAKSNKAAYGSIVLINPTIKLLIKEFFSRRLNWDRRVAPNYGILNRQKNMIVISNQRYIDNFSEYTKDRSNTKRFPFLYN